MKKDIYNHGMFPIIIKYFQNIDEKTAFDIEKELIIKFGRECDGGILTNKFIDMRRLGGGKKGMKRTKPRTEIHNQRLKISHTVYGSLRGFSTICKGMVNER
jgi:hypothetical protein